MVGVGKEHCEALLITAPLRVEAWCLRCAGAAPRVCRTGMGRGRSLQAAASLLQEPAAALAVAGLGGALVETLMPGDVVVASGLRAPDGRTIALDAEPVLRALRGADIPARAGVIASAERPVTGSERARLADTGACAVDMESFWLAGAAAGRPLAVVRVILDGPGRELWRVDLPRRLVYCLGRLRSVARPLAAWAEELTRTAQGPTGPGERRNGA